MKSDFFKKNKISWTGFGDVIVMQYRIQIREDKHFKVIKAPIKFILVTFISMWQVYNNTSLNKYIINQNCFIFEAKWVKNWMGFVWQLVETYEVKTCCTIFCIVKIKKRIVIQLEDCYIRFVKIFVKSKKVCVCEICWTVNAAWPKQLRRASQSTSLTMMINVNSLLTFSYVMCYQHVR